MEVRIERILGGAKPDPYKFKVLQLEHVSGNTIVLAKYDGCLTYNGEKLILMRGIHKDFVTLDPHFLEGHSVAARFEPTSIGWALARECAERL